MLLRFILSLVCLATALHAEETMVRTFETSAAPLQCYRALSEDWIYIQWNKARSAAFGGAPETTWKIIQEDSLVEQGVLRVMEPGIALEYTLFGEYVEELVHWDFIAHNGGTTVKLKHVFTGIGAPTLISAANSGQLWDVRIVRLKNYLDNRANSYLASPRGDGRYPGVLLLHDRFGLNSTVREMADSLAKRGYAVMAVDMFKGDRTSDVSQARKYEELVQDDQALSSVISAWNWLLSDSSVNSNRIGVIGLGYGGEIAMRMLAANAAVRVGVAWYPSDIPPDSMLTRIASPLMILHAAPATDKPTPQAETMSQKLVQQGVRAETLLIKGDTGFAEPANGASYNGAAAADAFRTTISFLDRRLKI